MPDRCVVFGCSNENSLENGISLHRIPFINDDRPEAVRRRKKWVDFVSRRRDKWRPTKHSVVCSKHFRKEDFEQRFIIEIPNTRPSKPLLKQDDFGTCVFPTIQEASDITPSLRSERQAKRRILKVLRGEEPSVADEFNSSKLAEDEEVEVAILSNEEDQLSKENDLPGYSCSFQSTSTNTSPIKQQSCPGCIKLTKRNRQLRNNWISAKFKLRKLRMKLKSSEKEIRKKSADDSKLSGTSMMEEPDTITEELDDEEDMDIDDEEDYFTEEEPEGDDDDASYDGDTDGTVTETDTDHESDSSTVYIKDDNIRTQPKFIVFLSSLLLLFNQFCFFCKASGPLVVSKQFGTMVEVTSICTNPGCRKEFVWKSQPLVRSSKIPAGNLLLSYAILAGGGSASKIVQIFKHMGLACIALSTFFKHQRKILFPSIVTYWKRYQDNIMEKLKSSAQKHIIAGDGRHDSMGHSAKYCSYTIFACTVSQIIHFCLVQRNECGSSTAMEYAAFQRCMAYLSEGHLPISTFISDRHTSIVKHMREKLGYIIHYFDLWHLKKKIVKIFTKLAKESGCDVLGKWTKACTNHLHWSACSTHNGNGKVILAKFSSFLSHIVDKHENLNNPLFNKCHHGPDIAERQWLLEDSVPYDKLKKALTKKSFLNAIQKASPIAQTSCLEGFHSVLNHFAPKMIHYSFPGMYCRHILAILHFNANLRRDVKVNKDGSNQLKVVFPKFKNGEGTVRDVRVEPNFDYVEEIFQTIEEGLENRPMLEEAQTTLKSMTPAHMNTMLQKQPKEEVIKQRERRQKMQLTKDVAPTALVTDHVESIVVGGCKEKAKPHCKACKNPMKDHKYVIDCPRNRSS